MTSKWPFNESAPESDDDFAISTLRGVVDTLIARRAEHGDKASVFSLIASLWAPVITEMGDRSLNEEDVAILMILFKVARQRHNPHVVDNYTDIAGYAALAADLATNGGTEVWKP